MAEASFTLQVGGSPASDALLESVQSIEVEDNAEQADMLRLRLATAVERDGGRWSVLDAGMFARLTNVRVGAKVGSGPSQPLIDAYVIDLRASFSSEPGRSSVEVVAMDGSALLQLKEEVKRWPDQSDSQIASAIFSAAGLTADVDDTQPVRSSRHTTTIQRGNALRFLRHLAERNGFETYVEVGADGRGVGHFHAPRLQEEPQGVLNVNMGSDTNIDGFTARNDLIGPTTAKASGYDAANRKDQPVDAQAAQQKSLGAQPTVGGSQPREVLLANTGLTESGELRTATQAVVDRSAMSLTAEGTVYGGDYPDVLRAKRPVLVRGAGQEFSGTWYVTRVAHTLGEDGYAQRLSMRRNASGVTRQENFAGSQAAAPQPAVRIP
jgi:phage protein D